MTRTSVTREYGWAMGHRLQHHDGLCRHPHGHSYVARVTVETAAPLDARRGHPDDGMVLDFHALDAVMRAALEPWDHAFMVEDGDPFLEALRFHARQTGELPRVVVVPFPPTAEYIAHDLAHAVVGRLPPRAGLRLTRVEVHEGPRSVATASFGEEG